MRHISEILKTTEQYRHECEVRHIASWKPDYEKIKAHLSLIAAKRGNDAAEKLRQDVWDKIKPNILHKK